MKEVTMSICRMGPLAVAATVLLAGLASVLDLSAQTAPPPTIVPPVTPRLNDPGPQLTIPQPGNPVQQPSARGTESKIAPERSANSHHRPSRHYVAKHRHVSGTHVSRKRDTSSVKGICFYEHCIKQCFDSGVQAVNLSRIGGGSCPDICKERGLGWFSASRRPCPIADCRSWCRADGAMDGRNRPYRG